MGDRRNEVIQGPLKLNQSQILESRNMSEEGSASEVLFMIGFIGIWAGVFLGKTVGLIGLGILVAWLIMAFKES